MCAAHGQVKKQVTAGEERRETGRERGEERRETGREEREEINVECEGRS